MGKTARKQSSGRTQADRAGEKGSGAENVGAGRRESARYIAEMSLELGEMARKSDLAFLSYLLELAAEEAAAQSRRT